jgi:hypothetical protein
MDSLRSHFRLRERRYLAGMTASPEEPGEPTGDPGTKTAAGCRAAAVLALAAHAALVMLMVMKRLYVATIERLDRVESGADLKEAARLRRGA